MLTRFEQKEVFVISSNENFHRYVRDNLPATLLFPAARIPVRKHAKK